MFASNGLACCFFFSIITFNSEPITANIIVVSDSDRPARVTTANNGNANNNNQQAAGNNVTPLITNGATRFLQSFRNNAAPLLAGIGGGGAQANRGAQGADAAALTGLLAGLAGGALGRAVSQQPGAGAAGRTANPITNAINTQGLNAVGEFFFSCNDFHN